MKLLLWIDKKDWEDMQKRYYQDWEDIVLRFRDIGNCIPVSVTITKRNHSDMERKPK